jgi:hypothetical protein
MAGEVVKIGSKVVLQSDAPSGARSVVFEDDGETGYFYALAPGAAALELLDALHVYNAEDDLRGVDCSLELIWSEDGQRAGLRLNASLWAAFDFERELGWCRSNFPPPAGRWKMPARPDWDDSLIRLF